MVVSSPPSTPSCKSTAAAVIWTPATGMQYLSDYAAAHGVTIPANWTLLSANAVSGGLTGGLIQELRGGSFKDGFTRGVEPKLTRLVGTLGDSLDAPLRRSLPEDADALCGVTIRLGMSHSGESAGSGSFSKTSR